MIETPHEIRPFKTRAGGWIFSDHSRNIRHEALVGGTDLILDEWCKTVRHGDFGLRLRFADEPFPGWKWTGKHLEEAPKAARSTLGWNGWEDDWDDWLADWYARRSALRHSRRNHAAFPSLSPMVTEPPALAGFRGHFPEASQMPASEPLAGGYVAAGMGNWYRWEQTGMEGWLCSVLLQYFDTAPDVIYIGVEPLPVLAAARNRLFA